MNALRIMITSGGGPGVWGLLHALRNLPGFTTTLLVSDPAPIETLGTAFADERVRLPDADDPAYVDELLDFCRRSDLDVLLPVYDGELSAVADRVSDFERIGTHVLIPPADVVSVCVDKRRTYQRLADTDFLPACALVKTAEDTARAIDRLGYPDRLLCVKPVDRTGGRGFHILDPRVDGFATHMFQKPGASTCTAVEFLGLRRRGPEVFPLIVAEYLNGEELGIDLLADRGRVIEMVVRRKSGTLLHGNPSRIEFRESPGEREWITRLTSALDLSGLLAIDARYDADHNLRLLEVNARPGAYIGMTCARLHLLAWAIDRLLGDHNGDRADYVGDCSSNTAMRVFADVLVGPNEAHVLDIASRTEEIHADACAVPGRTS